VARPEQAPALLESAKLIAPDDPFVASELGRAYLVAGKPERALAEFGRALALVPNNPQALSNRGVALLALKQTEAGREDFARALQIDPCLFSARLNLKRLDATVPPAADCLFSDEQRRALEEQ